jgi:hypothetical protein
MQNKKYRTTFFSIKEKEQCFSKKELMEVNEHKRVSNFTLEFTTTFAISANNP